MITCLIIEDQPPAQRILLKYIADLGTLDCRGTYTSALDALPDLQQQRIDLLFLDIHLPKMSGLDFLKSLTHPPQVILTTAFPDYALEGYELDVVDYLLKPFSFPRFVKAVAKVSQRDVPVAAPPTELFVKSGYEYIKVDPAELLYIHSDADYTELHLPKRQLLSSEPLRHWLDTLDGQQFLQIHKSYIVNRAHIERVSGSRVHLKGGHRLPIGRAYKAEFVRLILPEE